MSSLQACQFEASGGIRRRCVLTEAGLDRAAGILLEYLWLNKQDLSEINFLFRLR